eukprot:3303232-Prymnesium_polylepis.1
MRPSRLPSREAVSSGSGWHSGARGRAPRVGVEKGKQLLGPPKASAIRSAKAVAGRVGWTRGASHGRPTPP